MSKLRRSLCWKSAVTVLLIGAGTSAQAQVLRGQYVGASQERFGWACANTGDVDGDGTDDFIVGSPDYTPSGKLLAGRAVIFSGAIGTSIRSHDGSEIGDSLGCSVAGAGDVDNDGFPDYVVGAENHITSYFGEGLVVVYSGNSGTVLWTVGGTTAFGHLGHSVDGIGEVDGDVESDVIVGSTNNEIFVLGHLGATIYHLTGSNGFGLSVAGCLDLNSDGTHDFVVGIPGASVGPFNDFGAVAAFSGATGGWLWTSWGSHEYDYLGSTLASRGDVDHDGTVDVIAGSPYSDANGPDSGIVRVISGGSGMTIHERTGDMAGEFHGASVAAMGDVNLDGVEDYAVGATNAGSGSEGRVRICSGSDGTTIYEWYGDAATNRDLGCSVASGDWNGDGVPDLLSGDWRYINYVGHEVGSLDLYLMCPAWRHNYGTGWAGKNGIPSLTSQQNPVVGSPIDVVLGNSLGAATTALLIVGTQWTSVPTSRDGTLLVIPQLTVVLPVPANGLTLSDTLPKDPLLYFLDIYLQALEVDQFASKGLSFTPGLQLHCGFDLS